MARSRFPPAGRYQLSDRYRLDSWIAAGGVGEVWRAVDTVLDRAVAIKLLREEFVLDAQARARFRAEARHAGALCHSGIAQVYDYAESDSGDPPFLVMELVEGPSLAAVLAEGPLDPGRAMDVVAQTAAGLQAAHQAGLIHRDIKPANLLLTPAGQVKITDFGIAYAAGSAPLTRTGLLVGTPAYLAPERAMGASATAASDLYSLGIVAFECLTGTPPFTGVPLEVATAHRHRPLPPLPTAVPPPVASLVQALTSKDAAARPASAGLVAEQAAQLRDSLPSAPPAPATPPPAPTTPRSAQPLADAADPLAAWPPSPLAAPVSPAPALPAAAPQADQPRLLADTRDTPVVGHPPGAWFDGSPAPADPLASPAGRPRRAAPTPVSPLDDDPLGLAAGPAWPPQSPGHEPGRDQAPTAASAATAPATTTPATPAPATVGYARPNRFTQAEPSRYAGRHASPGRPGDTLAYGDRASSTYADTTRAETTRPGGHTGAETLPPGSVPPARPFSPRRQLAPRGQLGPRRQPGPGGQLGPRGLIAAALAAVVLIAALAIWLSSGSHGRTPAAHASHPGPTQSAGLARVSPRLAGQPVRSVARRLRALGLRVRVVRRPDFEVPPGTVVGLTPTGMARPGTVITLTVAAARHPFRPGRHGD